MGTSPQNEESIVQLNRAFWNREDTGRPLISFRTGSDMPFHYYRCAKRIQDRPVLKPEDIVPEEFFDDYMRHAEDHEKIKQDTFFGFDPFMGVPWTEAIAGCQIGTSDSSGWAHPPEISPEEWLKKDIDLQNNAWYHKLLEFGEKLAEFSAGRYPVTQPLFRGPSDLLHSILGHEEAVVTLVETPELCEKILLKCTNMFIDVLKGYNQVIPETKQGWLIGQYNIWAPEPCCRFQEDATSLHSPKIYKNYIRPCDESISRNWKYNLIHLHPASFYVLDELLKVKTISCVEISIDFDKEVEEMMPQLKKIQETGKCLLLEGRFQWETIKKASEQIDSRGLFYQVKKETVEEAQEFSSQFYSHFS